MSVKNDKLTREQVIQNIKDCGQSLIDNAEDIVDKYKYRCATVITCYVDNDDRAPYISIDTEIIPEKFVERVMEGKI